MGDLVGQPTSSEESPEEEFEGIDAEQVHQEIADGAIAFGKLLVHAAEDWTLWETVIRGLRSLCCLACARAHTTHMHSQAYHLAMRALLRQREYAVYAQIDKRTRSDCYKLMACLEEITVWYASLPPSDKLRWKHPSSIAKHCPRSLVRGGMRNHNSRKSRGPRKPAVTVETERIRALLIQVMYEPDAAELLDQIMPPGEPNDAFGDGFGDADA
jgi:hypothetical protein